MSKLVDSVVACQINNYVNRNQFNNYSNQHISLDIALLYIQNEVHLSLEHGESTVFILLDWSAAFNIVDDSNLLDCPTSWFSVCGRVHYFGVSSSAENFGPFFPSKYT